MGLPTGTGLILSALPVISLRSASFSILTAPFLRSDLVYLFFFFFLLVCSFNVKTMTSLIKCELDVPFRRTVRQF